MEQALDISIPHLNVEKNIIGCMALVTNLVANVGIVCSDLKKILMGTIPLP